MTKGLAIMLYISTPEIGDHFHNDYLKNYNFPRTRYPHSQFYTDYHMTIGYIKQVDIENIESITNHIIQDLIHQIPLDQVFFKFDTLQLFGPSHRQFVAALPVNVDEFCKYNEMVYNSLKSFKNGLYDLDPLTVPGRFLPHINLYAHLGKEIPIVSSKIIIESLQKKLHGVTIPLSKIKIH